MYIHTTTLNQHSEQAIRAANPNTSFPVPFVPPEGYAYVFPAPATYDPVTQTATETTPEQTVLGHWEQRWTVTDKSAEVIAAEAAVAAQAFQAAVVTATQARLDTFANTRNYDGILSACTYASSAVPKFQSEGQYCVNARDNTWAALYALMADVQAGTTPMPATIDEVVALLPELTWPV